MAKHLRSIATWPDPDVTAVLGDNTVHLDWMYAHYATPYANDGVAKVNVEFTADAATVTGRSEILGIPTPGEVLGTACVREFFDAAAYPSLSNDGQQRYYLERLHAAILRCARHFGWDERHFDAARDRMLADDLRFAFYWKKPLTSPDRRMKVQGFVEAGPRTRVWVVFFDRQMNELRRSLLAVTSTGSFAPPMNTGGSDLRHIFGRITWTDETTVRITMKNGRDYWLCGIDGTVEFHYPRAEQGDPHGEFDLGRMYFEGGLLPVDRPRGLELIRSAAAKGYKHALNFLSRMDRESDSAV